ncbi:MAG TPA: response regulator [Candidatus Polarisedimenticolaceae bacterium]|nr:response regulator [Candidatus Polarisedimenticolaceae bacterium]
MNVEFAPTLRTPPALRVAPRPHSARVLVVEDDEAMREWLGELIDEEGFEAVTAPDALTGMLLLLAEGADIVVTDWRMPIYDGLRLLESCRRLKPRLPVVMLTGYADPWLEDRVRRLGGILLTKPFDPADLIAQVRRAAASPRVA